MSAIEWSVAIGTRVFHVMLLAFGIYIGSIIFCKLHDWYYYTRHGLSVPEPEPELNTAN